MEFFIRIGLKFSLLLLLLLLLLLISVRSLARRYCSLGSWMSTLYSVFTLGMVTLLIVHINKKKEIYRSILVLRKKDRTWDRTAPLVTLSECDGKRRVDEFTVLSHGRVLWTVYVSSMSDSIFSLEVEYLGQCRRMWSGVSLWRPQSQHGDSDRFSKCIWSCNLLWPALSLRYMDSSRLLLVERYLAV